MTRTTLLIAATAALLFNAFVCSAEDKAPAASHDTMAGHNMMSGHAGQADLKGEARSHRCMHHGMRGDGAMPHMVPVPSLPPGNAKLELQMQAEMLQKIGEILGKYAAQVKDAPAMP